MDRSASIAEQPVTNLGRRLRIRPLLQDHPAAWRVARWAWLVSGMLFVVMAVPSLAEVVQLFDDAVHSLAGRLEFDPAVEAARFLDLVGSVAVTVPLIVAVGAWLAHQRHWEALFSWLTTMVLSQAMIGILKVLYARPRPDDALVETTNFAFPSGHAVAGAAIAIAAVIVLVPAGPARRNMEMVAAGFAVVMALSRVYLRAHWLSDVVAGVGLGAGIAIGTAVVLHQIDERREQLEAGRSP